MNAALHPEHLTQAPSAAAPQRRALRFLTAGSVDDGKSTLIGRLLFNSRAILADQLTHLEQRAAGAPIDLSLLTDGLEAEREQGITIDVAYRYFATPHRKFIIADAPGHEQYTRNMVTAAAGSDAAVVLVDITKINWRHKPVALLPQTRRHSLLAHLLRVPSIVFAINKIDAVDNPEQAFLAVSQALVAFAKTAGIEIAGILPVSALRGDNVTTRLDVPWYQGPALLELLESLPATAENTQATMTMPVQYVARVGDGANPERIFWGRIAQGSVKVGDAVALLPAGHRAQVVALRHARGDVAAVDAGDSAGIVLDRHVDCSRGDWIVASQASPVQENPAAEDADNAPQLLSQLQTTLAWLDTEPAQIGRKYLVRHAHRWVQARITQIHHRLDIETLAHIDAHELGVNEIATVTWQLQSPLPVQPYLSNRTAGALIVVDPAAHRTSGAALVQSASARSAA